MLLVLAACSSPEPTATPTSPPEPTATPVATATPVPTPTPTPTATATAAPTATPQPTATPPCSAFADARSAWDGGNPTCVAYPYPTPTPTPRPTATPTPRPTSTPRPTPTPTQPPITHLGQRSFDFMQALTGSTFLTDDGVFHAGYIGWNESNETFNALYYVPVSDNPECVHILMGSTLSPGHYGRTIERVLVLMGFYPDVAEGFTTRFVALAERTARFEATEEFFGWFVAGWSNERYNGVTITRDETLGCAAAQQPSNVEAPYSLPIETGWNLVSFPGSPSQTGISDVLPEESWWVTIALSYQQGEWRTAARAEDNTWLGTLTIVEPGYGYWLHSAQAGTLEVILLPVGDPSPLLSDYMNLTVGWNLVGVVDPELPTHGQPHSAGLTLDEYFSGTPWGVAFAYSTARAEWRRFNPGNDDPIRNGWGYWLWAGTDPPPDEPPSF